ncbi:MAG TPA: aspartate aminotransferase family protein [Planctomycetota bacterium]|nr:aspartate aminotransferase family protein [Planctomycetota bacterium]
MKFERSQQLLARAKKVIPGGISSNIRARWKPFPLFYTHGKDAHLFDVDGNRYIDYVLARGPLLFGHSPEPILEAVRRQLERGLMYAGQHELEIEVAEKICRHVPCAERVRFSNSGSEAVHMALRLARACTGRTKHIRFEGHYHGWLDNVFFSYAPKLEDAGPRERPRPVPVSKGLPLSDADNVIVLPWNDLPAVERVLAEHGADIAALITEPFMCNSGGILPQPGYLEGLRKLTSRHGIVLIFDEVITGFRLGIGGAQNHFGVTPDLATFAKAVGGGFCVSVLAGKAALMDEIATLATVHAGTYNSNPLCLAACKAALEMLEAGEGHIYRHINKQGRALMKGIEELAQQAGRAVSVRGVPPAFNVSFGECEAVTDYRSFLKRDVPAHERFWEALHNRGVRTIPEGTWFVSAAHTDEDVERSLAAVAAALQ